MFQKAAYVPDGKRSELLFKRKRSSTQSCTYAMDSQDYCETSPVYLLPTSRKVPTRQSKTRLHGIKDVCLARSAINRFAGGSYAKNVMAQFTQQGNGRVSRIMEVLFLSYGVKKVEDDAIINAFGNIGQETYSEWETEVRCKLAEAKSKFICEWLQETAEIVAQQSRCVVKTIQWGATSKSSAVGVTYRGGRCPRKSQTLSTPPGETSISTSFFGTVSKY